MPTFRGGEVVQMCVVCNRVETPDGVICAGCRNLHRPIKNRVEIPILALLLVAALIFFAVQMIWATQVSVKDYRFEKQYAKKQKDDKRQAIVCLEIVSKCA